MLTKLGVYIIMVGIVLGLFLTFLPQPVAAVDKPAIAAKPVTQAVKVYVDFKKTDDDVYGSKVIDRFKVLAEESEVFTFVETAEESGMQLHIGSMPVHDSNQTAIAYTVTFTVSDGTENYSMQGLYTVDAPAVEATANHLYIQMLERLTAMLDSIVEAEKAEKAKRQQKREDRRMRDA